MNHLPLFSESYLFSLWEDEFAAYLGAGADAKLFTLLQNWSRRASTLTETQLEGQFTKLFFTEIWGYWGTGERDQADGFCMSSQYGVAGAGAAGGKGAADLALGRWTNNTVQTVPQVLAEFKDIRSGLDTPQNRKGNNRSPVKQCLDYLKYAFDAINMRSPILPTWGIVTNMNEFRLYCRKKGDEFYQRFVIESDDVREVSLLGECEAAKRQRFLFRKLFAPDLLLSKSGSSKLLGLLENQILQERELEKEFYQEYRAYRQFVFEELVAANPNFSGTRGKLVKLTQRFLDRCIFLLFCEDMGKSLDFPTNLIQGILHECCISTYFSESGENIWAITKQLFRTMRDGGPFPPDHKISQFNGGLFEDYPDLENLIIPNRVFCTKNQGSSPDEIRKNKKTLFYLSSQYNYGVHGSQRERTITLYSLGRIFEQSIVELEYMAAEAEGKKSIAELSKRKRDGVYYTPEWVTGYIVRETIGAKLEEIRTRLGLVLGEELTPAEISYRIAHKGKIPESYKKRLQCLADYEQELEQLKVLDPSCGSGAFLIQALQFLLRERKAIAIERKRITGKETLFDQDTVMRSILSENLYGVDINQESVEITQLALWLHTALPGKALSNLDHHIRCGNSLVGPEFEHYYHKKHTQMLFADLDEQQREDVNIFDWAAAFPEVLGPNLLPEERGFDCIIGNPPYVKLQNFRQIKSDESDFYIEGRDADDLPFYESAQTGNFDLYLLFIEKGLSLLDAEGQMGFIAPSLWLKNEYGLGLRQKVKRLKLLQRWIDFKSYQVFDEATTYTAIQFFTRQANDAIRFFLAPTGNIAPVNWNGPTESINYRRLPNKEAWNLISKDERKLIERLKKTCLRLDDVSLTKQVFQGLITSADCIYHLNKTVSGKFVQVGPKADGLEYDLEPGIMHPLVSGAEAKRYLLPKTDTWILFPYQMDGDRPRLFTPKEMQSRFPKTWAYLKKYEQKLRERERNAFDDEQWFRFGRNQSLDKQELTKILISRLVTHLSCVADEKGEFYLDNVDVGGVMPISQTALWFLCGLLNATVCNFVFQRISKPFRGEYLSANKQYIAPLPIPIVSDQEKKNIGKQAKTLQQLHSKRRDKIAELARRLAATQCVDDHRTPDWLWAEVKSAEVLKAEASSNLSVREKCTWAKQQHRALLDAQLLELDSALFAGVTLRVETDSGEIRLLADAIPLISLFVEKNEILWIAAQWRQVARSTSITENFEVAKLLKLLLALRKTSSGALKKQVVKLDEEIRDFDAQITAAEQKLNGDVYRLYNMSAEEVLLVENNGIMVQ